MNKTIRISTNPDQLKEGLFGMVFLWVFEILPYLETQGIFPAWTIRSTNYGNPTDFIVIPGLLDINYECDSNNCQEVNLQELRKDHVATLGNDWEYTTKLWNKYFRIPSRIIRRADKIMTSNHMLGIHYRGTDKNVDSLQTNPVSHEHFLILISDFIQTHPDIDTLFVSTDEFTFLERIQSVYKGLRILNTGTVTFWKDAVIDDDFSKGDHALLDCLMLSRCKYLLKCQSALSAFAKIFNPQLEAYRVSASKLLRWDGYVPYFPDAYIPKLTSENQECQNILDNLCAGDWTQDTFAVEKYGILFKYRYRFC